MILLLIIGCVFFSDNCIHYILVSNWILIENSWCCGNGPLAYNECHEFQLEKMAISSRWFSAASYFHSVVPMK